MYGDVSLIIEHCFNTIAVVERYGPGQPASDDDVAGLDVASVLGELANQPDNTRRRMT